jgi:16S rRNA (cytidine1402-2'-O)-methyltransferase
VALGTLYVCAVPIGNLEDASPRLRRVLGEVDVVACEDTRTTGRLLELLGVERRAGARMLAHHEHNARASAPGIVALLAAGSDVALVSDAGTPAVSDPGVELVAAARAAGARVEAVAGPSAVAAAVSVAGVAGSGYRFVGFLPRSSKDLAALLASAASDVLVAFEAPRRLQQTLDVLAATLPDRRVVVCRELTKLHEEVVEGTAGELRAHFDDDVRGELVLVLAPVVGAATVAADPRALALVEAMVDGGVRLKAATRIVAEHLGGSARELYDAAHVSRDRD